MNIVIYNNVRVLRQLLRDLQLRRRTYAKPNALMDNMEVELKAVIESLEEEMLLPINRGEK